MFSIREQAKQDPKQAWQIPRLPFRFDLPKRRVLSGIYGNIIGKAILFSVNFIEKQLRQNQNGPWRHTLRARNKESLHRRIKERVAWEQERRSQEILLIYVHGRLAPPPSINQATTPFPSPPALFVVLVVSTRRSLILHYHQRGENLPSTR
jgi:hypothetical protein